ncbi:MAG: helix-turn-helix domain-containing protein [Hormoscilla sp. GM7CHS1pb]|nr:helix-turn-helix domain-containing protein [Hormoscilla sp. GM7CHS1pb]
MDYAELGHRIRQAREEATLSQDVVAQHLGLTPSAVSLIESGKRKVDSLELRSFSQLVGKSVAFFLDDETARFKDQPMDDDDPTHILFSANFSANEVVDIAQDRPQIEWFWKAEVTDIPLEISKFPVEYEVIDIPLEISKFPVEYVDMAFEEYSLGYISLGKLAELLDVPIEEAKAQLEKRNAPVDLGVSSKDELLSDIENA